MDWNLIAQGLRLIADGIDSAEGDVAGNDPTPTPASTDEKQKRHRRTKAEMEAARAAEAAAAATTAVAAPATGTASTTAPGPAETAEKAPDGKWTGYIKPPMEQPSEKIAPSPMWQGLEADKSSGLTAEKLSEILTTAAKKHGRTLIAELLQGKRVADMTQAERETVKLKIDHLDSEKEGESW